MNTLFRLFQSLKLLFNKYFPGVLKHISIELLIVFIYVVSINNYFGNVDEKIKADGIGYYDYLPSIFIHHDIVRKDVPFNKDSNLYSRINDNGVYVEYEEFLVNKYPCGTALLELPFFLFTYLLTDIEGDSLSGYERPFHTTVFHAALFYLFLSLLFLKGTLRLFGIRKHMITLIQVLLVLATTVTNYAHFDAAFSHIYSLFAITGFIYFAKSYFSRKELKHFMLACLLLGLVVILRQTNILILLFIPFLAGSMNNLKDGFLYLWRQPVFLVIGILVTFGIFSIQGLLWYVQTGKFLIMSYQGEGFNFHDPYFFSILFGYGKGLFVYTPILFTALISMIWLLHKREFFLVITWFGFFIILTYVLSSWWNWFFGDSFGLRAYIDFYTIFFIPVALMLNGLNPKIKAGVVSILLLTIPVNYIQSVQYREFIFHWNSMEKEMFWKVFLRTNPKYKGLLWKINYDYSQFQIVGGKAIGTFAIPPREIDTLYDIHSSIIPDFQDVSIIQVLFDSDFKRKNDSQFSLTITDKAGDQIHYYHILSFVQFVEEGFREWQTGSYNFKFAPLTENKDVRIILKIESGKVRTEIKNLRIRYFKPI